MAGMNRWSWLAMAAAILVAGGAGLMYGKLKEKDYLASMNTFHDFTLLDDQGEFFHLNELPASSLALLIFTPDGIPTNNVKPFSDFFRHAEGLKAEGLEIVVISRSNREIVRNFLRATRFPVRFLVDAGGSVGLNLGAWSNIQPSREWSYILVDRKLQVYWSQQSAKPVSYEDFFAAMQKVSASLSKNSTGK
jgi:peroxiredoxin